MTGAVTRIKICGVRTPRIARCAADAGADMIGLVFVERSPRCVTIEQARPIAEAVRSRVEIVALVMHPDEQAGLIERIEQAIRPTMFQFHGRYLRSIAQTEGPRFMCAASFDEATFAGDVKRIRGSMANASRCAGLIVDTPDPSDIGGGTGRTFDWRMLRDKLDAMSLDLPLVLAGGLDAQNVAEAIGIVRPAMVDVSSGVETQRGVKDPGLIEAFCRAVRGDRS